MNRFDADRDYDDFERWFHDLPEAQFGDFAFAWMETLKAGDVMPRGGFETFRGWMFDAKWPDMRMAREIDRLTTMADAARLAA